MLYPFHACWFDHPNNILWESNHKSSSSCNFLQFAVTAHLGPNIFLNVTDQVSNPFKTTCKMIVLYTLIFILLDNKCEDKRFWTEWQQAFPEFNLLLILGIIAQNKSPFEKRSWTTLISVMYLAGNSSHCGKFRLYDQMLSYIVRWRFKAAMHKWLRGQIKRVFLLSCAICNGNYIENWRVTCMFCWLC